MAQGVPQNQIPPADPVTDPDADALDPDGPPDATAGAAAGLPDGGAPATQGLQAAFTQARMTLSEVEKALGLPKGAPTDRVVAAIATLKSRPKDGETLDPETQARIQRADEREWKSAEREFGADVVAGAQAFRDALANYGTPYELVAAYNLGIQEAAAANSGQPKQTSGASQASGQPNGGQQAPQPRPEIGLDTDQGGSVGPRRVEKLDEVVKDLKGTGKVGEAFRRLRFGQQG